MNEREVIAQTSSPVTVRSLTSDLRALGVEAGDVLVVHSSLSALGWVAGGAGAVVDALLEVVGPHGTVSMPSHSGDWSDPAQWENPPVPPQWWDEIVTHRPAFDPYATPMRQMGAVAENLLMRRDTRRSSHPLHSHMAHGPQAATIVAEHRLEDSFGDSSPLGRLYELGAKVLLLGVGHACNTSLHLAEARASWPSKAVSEQLSTVHLDGEPTVVRWAAQTFDADDFEDVGRFLDDSGLVTLGTVGQGQSRLARMRAMVDAATPWFESHRR